MTVVLRIPALCAALLSVLVLSACASSSPTPVEDPAADPAPADQQAPSANLTDDCAEGYTEGVDYFPDKVDFEHTSNVEVSYGDNYKTVTVVPLRAPEATPVSYVLVQCGTPAPELDGELADAQVIDVPVREVVSLTTSNLPHFEVTGTADRVIGVGNPDFVTTESVRERIEAGEVPGFADETGQADLERLISTAPDLLIIDGFGDTVLEDVARYVDSGVPTVLNADFVESGLLGRAEWLKFTALFTNTEQRAREAFDDIARAYDEIAAAASEVEQRPTVLANTPYEGTWYMPGGDSYFAHAIADAGGTYVFADDDSQSTLQLDFETVLDQAADADLWLQAGSVNGTLDDLLSVDERFTEFAAFRDGQVYAYDNWTSPGGGYAVFEVAYTRADLFLADLVKILHPDLLPDHELVFFGQVPDGQ